ncbi:DUF3108 domain-containing protein [Arsenicibacter rosenii]|uniref:ATP-dependent exodnase (Exonuclease V) alpha subunit-helicase superfamily I member n=1 Tax=Arsenicibacter rosenii TaxID=1750698 RepID=A0A1S2VM39_9BACT|nr:DUF3108 domain-containing protein [Arsenicibacter rosenii]OIN59266.1 ATP-dependent exodnase (exonuclease V) alpha subunit - helicase superfamily I member [Arsenicibacter rosenii]
MKKLLGGLLLAVTVAFGFTTIENPLANAYRRIVNNSFGPGERIEYRVHYGFINAAEATVDVAPALYKVNDRPCFKVNVFGRTTGAFDLVTRVRDTWRSYVDTGAILPQRFYRNIQEGNYRKEENVTFNHFSNTAKSEEKVDTDVFKVPDNVHDVVSGYFFLRTIDFNKFGIGQVIEVPAFFDDKIYNMKVKYQGKAVLKTKFGKINVIKLNPVMPPNGFFKDEDSIRIWVSDDNNKVPMKVEVDLAIGSLDMDIRDYGGLKQDFRFFK